MQATLSVREAPRQIGTLSSPRPQPGKMPTSRGIQPRSDTAYALWMERQAPIQQNQRACARRPAKHLRHRQAIAQHDGKGQPSQHIATAAIARLEAACDCGVQIQRVPQQCARQAHNETADKVKWRVHALVHACPSNERRCSERPRPPCCEGQP